MKTKMYTVFAAVTLSAVAVPAFVSAQQAEPQQANLFPYDDAGAVARGSVLYADNCASCHGAELEGQDNLRAPGPNGRALAPPHDETGHTWHHPDIQLFQIIKLGTAALVGNGYESDMAGYEGVLTDAEIIEIMAYVKSTWPNEITNRHNAMNISVANQ